MKKFMLVAVCLMIVAIDLDLVEGQMRGAFAVLIVEYFIYLMWILFKPGGVLVKDCEPKRPGESYRSVWGRWLKAMTTEE